MLDGWRDGKALKPLPKKGRQPALTDVTQARGVLLATHEGSDLLMEGMAGACRLLEGRRRGSRLAMG